MIVFDVPFRPRAHFVFGFLIKNVRFFLCYNQDNAIMAILFLVFGIFTFIILVGDILLLPEDRYDWCQPALLLDQGVIQHKEYKNIDAIRDPCYYHRTIYLLGFSPFECDFGRRMICSVILGAAIGWERKAADRPAGIRTMSLVSLGSATFTMAGQFAFRASPQTWDAARVSAAIPSGVGFLGSALIWKEVTGEKGSPDQRNHVHGIATAASVWLSASIGIGVGGALYVMSTWTVILVLFVLRLVPQLLLDDPCDDELVQIPDKDSREEDRASDRNLMDQLPLEDPAKLSPPVSPRKNTEAVEEGGLGAISPGLPVSPRGEYAVGSDAGSAFSGSLANLSRYKYQSKKQQNRSIRRQTPKLHGD